MFLFDWSVTELPRPGEDWLNGFPGLSTPFAGQDGLFAEYDRSNYASDLLATGGHGIQGELGELPGTPNYLDPAPVSDGAAQAWQGGASASGGEAAAALPFMVDDEPIGPSYAMRLLMQAFDGGSLSRLLG